MAAPLSTVQAQIIGTAIAEILSGEPYARGKLSQSPLVDFLWHSEKRTDGV